MRSGGKKLVEEKYTWEKIADKVLDVYKGLI